MSIRPSMAARRRSRSALEAAGISAADLRTILLTADFFDIPSPLGGARRTRADDSGHFGLLGGSVGPRDDQDNPPVVRVRRRGHVAVFVAAVLRIKLIHVNTFSFIVRA